VNYEDLPPWPVVSGNGLALSRRPVQAYGNDPVNWQVFSPTRGLPNSADADGDGQPDSWEFANALSPSFDEAAQDNDGDGQTNLAEYIAGTDPRDGASSFRVDAAVRIPGGVRITFTAQPGKTYTVQYRQNLTGGNWLKLADVPSQPSEQPVNVDDHSVVDVMRFYRVVTPAQ
jgi:hypothetical protein